MKYYKYLDEAGNIIGLSTEGFNGGLILNQRGSKTEISKEEYDELVTAL